MLWALSALWKLVWKVFQSSTFRELCFLKNTHTNAHRDPDIIHTHSSRDLCDKNICSSILFTPLFEVGSIFSDFLNYIGQNLIFLTCVCACVQSIVCVHPECMCVIMPVFVSLGTPTLEFCLFWCVWWETFFKRDIRSTSDASTHPPGTSACLYIFLFGRLALLFHHISVLQVRPLDSITKKQADSMHRRSWEPK